MNRAAAFEVVERFEAAVAEYTGAPFAVAVDSCTNAIFLALVWWRLTNPRDPKCVVLPSYTYVGVAQAVRNAGVHIKWQDFAWGGKYLIWPSPVWDAAKRFTSGMYRSGTLTCLSFQAGKILPIGRGGAILTDSLEARDWLRRARFDGRTPGDDAAPITTPGWHMYLTPPEAARGLWLLSWLPKDNADLPCDEYEDLSTMEAFR